MSVNPMNDLFFVEAVSQQWVEAVVLQGGRCFDALAALRQRISPDTYNVWNARRRLGDRMRVEEHFFVIALGKAIDWLSELKSLKPAAAPRIDAFLQSLPHAVDVRNMREHDIEYFGGEGRNQGRFWHSHMDSSGQVLGRSDASATAVFGDEYMIGGRLNVRRTMELCEALIPDVFVPPSWANASGDGG